MDGKTYLRQVRELLGESSSSAYMDDRTTYQYLWDAACQLAIKTRSLTEEETITTVANQSGYVLPADFIELYLRDRQGQFFIKYNDGTNISFLPFAEYEDVVYANNTSSQAIPNWFTIVDQQTPYDQITGTATSTGGAVGGKSTLVDTSAVFLSSDHAEEGDSISSLSRGFSGIVVGVTDDNTLECATWDDASTIAGYWIIGDPYVIQPQGRMQIELDPPPSTSGHTFTVYYVARPSPVFHDYGVYRFQYQYLDALIEYAAMKYKTRDSEPGFSREFEDDWQRRTKEIGVSVNDTRNRKGFSFSLRRKPNRRM
jgi:hypothetical protein